MAPLGPTLFIMQYIGNYVSSEHYTEHYFVLNCTNNCVSSKFIENRLYAFVIQHHE